MTNQTTKELKLIIKDWQFLSDANLVRSLCPHSPAFGKGYTISIRWKHETTTYSDIEYLAYTLKNDFRQVGINLTGLNITLKKMSHLENYFVLRVNTDEITAMKLKEIGYEL